MATYASALRPPSSHSHESSRPTTRPFRAKVSEAGPLRLAHSLELTVASASSSLEREADRVAEQVVSSASTRMAPTITGFAPEGLAQRQCSSCAQQEPEELVQRKESGGAAHSAGSGRPTRGFEQGVSSLRRHGGLPLPPATRAFMESRFGADFGSVRLHRGSQADSLAHAIHARAFTIQDDIFLARDHQPLDSKRGRRLLAHELTHTLQQRDSRPAIQRAPAAQSGAQGSLATRGVVIDKYRDYVDNRCFEDIEKKGEGDCTLEERRREEDAYAQLMRALKHARRADKSYAMIDFFEDIGVVHEYALFEAEQLWKASFGAFSDVLLSGFDNTQHVITRDNKVKATGFGGRLAADHQTPAQIHRDNTRAAEPFQRADVLVFSGHHYGDYITKAKGLKNKKETVRRQTGVMTAWRADHWLDVRKISSPQSNHFDNVKLVMSTGCATLCRQAIEEWRSVFPNAVVFGYRKKSPKMSGNLLKALRLPSDLILEEDMPKVLQSWRAAIDASKDFLKKFPYSDPGYYDPKTGKVHYYRGGSWFSVDGTDKSNPSCNFQEDVEINDRGVRPDRPNGGAFSCSECES